MREKSGIFKNGVPELAKRDIREEEGSVVPFFLPKLEKRGNSFFSFSNVVLNVHSCRLVKSNSQNKIHINYLNEIFFLFSKTIYQKILF